MLRQKINQYIYGNQTFFRIVNAGENEFNDPVNIEAYQRGVHKLMFEKYHDLLKNDNLPFIGNYWYQSFLGAGSLMILASQQYMFQIKAVKMLFTVGFLMFQGINYFDMKQKSTQIFLQKNFFNFTEKEQKALKTGDHRFFMESFGDLKNDKTTQRQYVM